MTTALTKHGNIGNTKAGTDLKSTLKQMDKNKTRTILKCHIERNKNWEKSDKVMIKNKEVTEMAAKIVQFSDGTKLAT